MTTNEGTAALIEKARLTLLALKTERMSDRSVSWDTRMAAEEVIGQLADRLAALTTPQEGSDALEARQPSENDRECLARLLAAQDGEEWDRLVGAAEYARNRYLRKAWAIMDRMPSLLPAAVPDVATTDPRFTGGYQLGANDIPALVAQIDRLESVAAQRKQRNADAEAERDAALAAVERVRAVLANDELVWSDGSYTNDLVVEVKDVLAALDVAPEPETLELFPGTNAALDRLTVRKDEDANAFCIEHGNFHAVELGDPTCEFEDGFGEPVEGESGDA